MRIVASVDAHGPSANFGVVARIFGDRDQVLPGDVDPDTFDADPREYRLRQGIPQLDHLEAEIISFLQVEFGWIRKVVVRITVDDPGIIG